ATLCRSQNLIEIPSLLREHRRSGERELRVTDDAEEQVVEVVGDPSGERPDGLHLLRLPELFFVGRCDETAQFDVRARRAQALGGRKSVPKSRSAIGNVMSKLYRVIRAGSWCAVW